MLRILLPVTRTRYVKASKVQPLAPPLAEGGVVFRVGRRRRRMCRVFRREATRCVMLALRMRRQVRIVTAVARCGVLRTCGVMATMTAMMMMMLAPAGVVAGERRGALTAAPPAAPVAATGAATRPPPRCLPRRIPQRRVAAASSDPSRLCYSSPRPPPTVPRRRPSAPRPRGWLARCMIPQTPPPRPPLPPPPPHTRLQLVDRCSRALLPRRLSFP